MARMAIGMAASITCPTFRPEYAEATVKMMHRKRPQAMARPVLSGGVSCGRTIGSYDSPWARVT